MLNLFTGFKKISDSYLLESDQALLEDQEQSELDNRVTVVLRRTNS